jgi:hypothetical protein
MPWPQYVLTTENLRADTITTPVLAAASVWTAVCEQSTVVVAQGRSRQSTTAEATCHPLASSPCVGDVFAYDVPQVSEAHPWLDSSHCSHQGVMGTTHQRLAGLINLWCAFTEWKEAGRGRQDSHST